MTFTKITCLFFGLVFQTSLLAQQSEPFKGIDFDSSFCILGVAENHGGLEESMQKFTFIIDNPDDMIKLKKEWIFKNQVSKISIEPKPINIFIIRDKRLFNPGSLIYPIQGIIKSGNNWYEFDTSKLIQLHQDHPLKYHTKKYRFDTYTQYAAFGNSLLHDSSLLFFFQPNLTYEGKFTIIAHRTSDPASPAFALRDINKELELLAPSNTFQASYITNDSFNIATIDRVKITVECSKTLYDKYKSRRNKKGEWIPSVIEIKAYWRD